MQVVLAPPDKGRLSQLDRPTRLPFWSAAVWPSRRAQWDIETAACRRLCLDAPRSFLTGQAASFVNRPTKSRNVALRSAGKDFIVTSPKSL